MEVSLVLSEREAAILHELLQSHLPELRREVARTDQATLRRELAERREVAERIAGRLLERLAAPVG